MLANHSLLKSSECKDNFYYLEWSSIDNQDGPEDYFFHLSFKTCKVANHVYDKMKNTWMLPVDIKENRITIFPAQHTSLTGVYEYTHLGGLDVIAYVGIRFLNQEHANEFCELFQPRYIRYQTEHKYKDDVCNPPRMACSYGCIYYDKSTLIRNKYSLDRRVDEMSFINHMICALHCICDAQWEGSSVANDITYYIMKMFVTHEIDNQYSFLNKCLILDSKFNLNKQFTPLASKHKIPVSVKGIKYEDVKKDQYSMFLACENINDFKKLYKKLIQYNFRVEKIFSKTLKINPGHMSHVGFAPGVYFRYDTISLIFGSEIARFKILDYFQFNNAKMINTHSAENDSIRFQTDTLNNFTPAHINFDYDTQNITSNITEGKNIRMNDVSDSFTNWFDSISANRTIRFSSIQIFKSENNEILIDECKSKLGIILKKNNDGIVACNNVAADTAYDTISKKAEFLVEYLTHVDSIVEEFKINQTLQKKHDIENIAANEPERSGFMQKCIIS